MTKKKKATAKKAPAKKARAKQSVPSSSTSASASAAIAVEVNEHPVLTDTINLTLSESLQRKLKDQSEEEGITVEELCVEMLSESVVVRAWEIAERRVAMRGGNGASKQAHQQGNGNGGGGGGQRNGGRRHNNNRRGNMSNSRYQNIMEDGASFLEYVRNQERQGR